MGPRGRPPSVEQHGTVRGRPAVAPFEVSESAGVVQPGLMVLVLGVSAGCEEARGLRLVGRRDAGALLCAAPEKTFYCRHPGLPR